MYPTLFGLALYDVIGVLGYLLILLFFLRRRNRIMFSRGGKGGVWIPLAVHLFFYTLGGAKLGDLMGRATEFFGYLLLSAVAMVLAALMQGQHPLRWLDRTMPLYGCLAAALKLSCFCGGCCNGRAWEYGLYNQHTQQREFPIQLVEMAAYALLTLLLRRYKGRKGQRFALLVCGYAATRFVVQFFRADVAVFTAFHWMSAAFFAVGGVMWLLCELWHRKKQCFT